VGENTSAPRISPNENLTLARQGLREGAARGSQYRSLSRGIRQKLRAKVGRPLGRLRPAYILDCSAGERRLAQELDALLLGLVDLLGAVRRHVHCADFERSHGTRVRARGNVRSHAGDLRVDDRVRQHEPALRAVRRRRIAQAVSQDISTAIYALLERLPLAPLSSLLAALVVALFFVTSSDSGSFVVRYADLGRPPEPRGSGPVSSGRSPRAWWPPRCSSSGD
jgi:hypothetical protein